MWLGLIIFAVFKPIFSALATVKIYVLPRFTHNAASHVFPTKVAILLACMFSFTTALLSCYRTVRDLSLFTTGLPTGFGSVNVPNYLFYLCCYWDYHNWKSCHFYATDLVSLNGYWVEIFKSYWGQLICRNEIRLDAFWSCFKWCVAYFDLRRKALSVQILLK